MTSFISQNLSKKLFLCVISLSATVWIFKYVSIPLLDTNRMLFSKLAVATMENVIIVPYQRHNGTSALRGDGTVNENLCQLVDIFSKPQITSAKYSKITNVFIDSDSSKAVVTIVTFTRQNVSKTMGGDLILLWANQAAGDGRVAGHVVDHSNGTYTGTIRIYWTGESQIHVKLGAALENTCLRFHALEKYGNSVFSMENGWGICGVFKADKLNRVNEHTPCGGNPFIYGYSTLCNFTDINDGMTWFCGHPRRKGLTCGHIYSFGTGPFNTHAATSKEKVLLPTVETFLHSVTVTVNRVQVPQQHVTRCSERRPIESWTELSNPSSGFWMNGQWRFSNCFTKLDHIVNSYRQCLKGKFVYFFGDSTVRQYAEYFIKDILQYKLKSMRDALGRNRMYHPHTAYQQQGITVKYTKHVMPFHNPDLPPSGMTSYTTELDRLAHSNVSDEDLILVINYHTHFQAYPLYVYRERTRKLAQSLHNLLDAKPRAKIFFKGFFFCFDDTRWFDNKMTLMYKDIANEEFSDLRHRITYLDAWSITVAHDSKSLHPQHEALTSQIQQLMSYIC